MFYLGFTENSIVAGDDFIPVIPYFIYPVILLHGHGFFCHGSINIVTDRKRCGRIIGNNEKETAAVAVPQRLGKAFAVYSSRKQCLIIYSKRLVIAVHPFSR